MHVPTPIRFRDLIAFLFVISLGACIPLPAVPTGANVVRPTTRSQFEVWTGAIRFDTGVGKIFKDGRSTDVTTLVTFDFPAAAAGKTCAFHFFLDSTAIVSGSGQFDVFSSLAPATANAASWPPGNQRNQYLGRLQVSKQSEATWVDGIPQTIKSFPCPTGTWAGEFVGVGDQDDIEWSGTGSSSYFTFA
jgi:hypothetical protein